MNRVIIDQAEDGTYGLYNQAGCVQACDFDSYDEAEQYAKDNGYEVVDYFNG